ncbi:MAG TPA: MoxR family ATPase, partial [Pirellulales bacterium]|nr:MoxR family ATPase [Pirellulales bacterium]
RLGYPAAGDEWELARRMSSSAASQIEPVVAAHEIIELQQLVGRVPVSDQVLGYAHALVRASRPGSPEAPEFVNRWVSWGSGPRGLLALISCAKARAILYGRYHASVADVQSVVKPALRHRIAANYPAQAAGVGGEQLIELLLESVPAEKRYERPAR